MIASIRKFLTLEGIMRAVGYIRVSTAQQTHEGISLEMQVSKIRQYCALNDLELAGIYGDPGISGKSIKARPGIQTVLDMVRRKRIDAVVTYKLDRIARNTVETLEMVERMDKAGVALHSISERLDSQSAIGRFVVRTLASLAEMERDLVSERTVAALAEKRARGQKTGGSCPFGYRVEEAGGVKMLVADSTEQMIIARIHDLQADGYSFRQIARELTREGYRTKSGCEWSAVQVSRILKRAA